MKKMKLHNETHILERIKELSLMLGDRVQFSTCYDSKGDSWKKITIVYDKKLAKNK